MRRQKQWADQSGMALITALLALMLVSALMAGLVAAVSSDQRGTSINRDQTQAYAAAHAGLEQLTSDLGQLFATDVSPSGAQITAVAATPPSIPGFDFVAPGGGSGSGYSVTFTADANGNPQAIPNADITTGPFTGFKGLVTPYTMTVTARSNGGGAEVRLRRGLQTVAVPVFQFGIFSETDLSIFSGGGFNFGGRVHTNGSLFVAAQTSGTTNITFTDRITAVNEVIRNYLSNGLSALTSSPSFTNQVLVPTSSSTNQNLRQSPNEGSVVGMPGSAANPNWTTISTGTFKSYIRTGLTGARRLDLPLVSQGAQPIDLIRRPLVNSVENVNNPVVFQQRFFSQASLRILLSDRTTDITNLPTVTATAPVLLNGADGAAGNWTVAPPAGYGPVDASHPPIARSMGQVTVLTNKNGDYSSGVAQIYVTSIPTVYKVPLLTLTNGAGAQFANIPCKGKTGQTSVAAAGANPAISANRFFGCTIPTGIGAAPFTVKATIDNVVITKSVVGTPTTGTNGYITVNANDTAPFSPGLIWVNSSAPSAGTTAVPVTCEGYTESISGSEARFLNCRGLSAAVANNEPISTSALANQNTGTIGGYIKIEKQDAAGNWTDVTMEILNLGIGAPNSGGTVCPDPTPNAVIRIQRLRDNGGGASAVACTYNNSLNSWDWWPNTLYDAREGSFRDSAAVSGMTSNPMIMGGVMQFITLDIGNLKRWFAGTIGTTGTAALNNNGYIVYFSDRRGNHDPGAADAETGEYGFEDFVNSTTSTGQPDGVLQSGEDVNVGDPRWTAGSQQLYGGTPWNNAVNIPTGSVAPYSFAAGRPQTTIPKANTATNPGAGIARVNKVILFRRALKLENGGIVGGVNNLPTAGLTVVAENPVYVQGNYNATDSPAPNTTWSNQEPNVPAAIIADAVTLLSRSWKDSLSFEAPNYMPARDASTTAYRFGVIAGKGLSFPYCAAACGSPGQLFGTDGGAANFLRLLEDWGSAATYYRGSIISLHTNRQAVGTYKFAASNNHIYNAGSRNFSFDVDFLTPSLLPPGTPMFRDINTLQFRQILRPNQ